MKPCASIVAISLALPFVLFVAEAHAANACVQLCQEKNRIAVNLCNYPKKELPALTECLATARRNFDACRQGC